MIKNLFQIKFGNYSKKNEKSLVQRMTNHEKEETDKIRANKMIRGSLIKHDQVEK